MARLSSVSFKKLQKCILEIYSDPDATSLPGRITAAVSRVIPSSVSSYAQISHVNKTLVYTGIYSCRKWEELAAFSRGMHEHPLTNFLHSDILGQHRFSEDIERAVKRHYPHLKHSHHNTVARISDVLSDRQFRSLALYNDFFRRNGVEYQLLVSLMPGPDGYMTLSFNRDRRDFSEEERSILQLLCPHIVQVQKNAEYFAKARTALSALESSHLLIKEYGLTSREEDVLFWVAQGKTNGEVAKILNIASGTVKNHLERVYQKLGVENRTSAARFFAGGG